MINNINRLHFNYLFLKNERIQINKKTNVTENKLEILELQNVCLDINGRRVLDNICLKIEKDDKTALIGRNASGKTTVMKTLAGMLDITSGEIYLNQNKVCPRKKNICYIPADMVYFQWEKLDDVFFEQFVQNAGYDKAGEIVQKVKGFLEHSMPSEGEKKVLMIMRAFSSACDLIILDEPFANLDSKWKKDMEELIYGSGRTVVFSTHDMSGLGQCRNVYEMKKGKCVVAGR